jgi:hypothetical protein
LPATHNTRTHFDRIYDYRLLNDSEHDVEHRLQLLREVFVFVARSPQRITGRQHSPRKLRVDSPFAARLRAAQDDCATVQPSLYQPQVRWNQWMTDAELIRFA